MAVYYLAAIFFVALDRFLKVLAFNFFQDNGVNLIGEFLSFRFESNYNIALSIPLHGFILQIIIPFLIFGILFYSFVLIKKNEINSAGILTIIAFAAMSNFYDRLYYGFVIDYFDVKWFSVFNLVDAVIFLSCLTLIFLSTKKHHYSNSDASI